MKCDSGTSLKERREKLKRAQISEDTDKNCAKGRHINSANTCIIVVFWHCKRYNINKKTERSLLCLQNVLRIKLWL